MIAVINYSDSNTQSIVNALEELKIKFVITSYESDLNKADKIIFPGVGNASFAVKKLHILNLFSMLRIVKIPFLGTCLGMQLLCEKSTENNNACLGILPCNTLMLENSKSKVPHIGWSKVTFKKESKLFNNIPDDSYFYFEHYYYLPLFEYTVAKTNYGIEFTSAVEKDNFYGVQFYPEKSGEYGIKLINNFIELC